MRSVHRATTARPAAATLAALLLAATLAACGDDGGDEGDRAAPADVVVLAADVERVEPGPDAPVAEVVAGIEAFGLRAERILAQDGGNTVLSPLSVATAFAMVSAGADEPTEALRALGVDYGQGNHLGVPGPLPEPTASELPARA